MVDTKGMAFGCICVCAVRYACGRQTYMPSIVKRFVHDNLKEIETSSLKVKKNRQKRYKGGNQ